MRRGRTPPGWALESLEALVLVSGALAGPRARALLEGLLAPLAAAAGTRLAALERQGTAEHHARWIRVFRPSPGDVDAAADIPGRVGNLVRTRLAGGGPVLAAVESPAPGWVRWSSRLALEQQASDAPVRPPARRHVPSSGRGGSRPGGDLLARPSQGESCACSPSPVRHGWSRSIGG
jgi:hypothetical protein